MLRVGLLTFLDIFTMVDDERCGNFPASRIKSGLFFLREKAVAISFASYIAGSPETLAEVETIGRPSFLAKSRAVLFEEMRTGVPSAVIASEAKQSRFIEDCRVAFGSSQ